MAEGISAIICQVVLLLVTGEVCCTADIANAQAPDQDVFNKLFFWNLLASFLVVIAALTAFACCTCGACRSKGVVQPTTYNQHTHDLKQVIHVAKKQKRPDRSQVVRDLYNTGVRAHNAEVVLSNEVELRHLGITESSIELLGGRMAILQSLKDLERSHGADSRTKEDAPRNVAQKLEKPTIESPAIRIPLPKHQMGSKNPPTQNVGGLDEKADFDDYTIYDEGVLNQYGVLKAEKGKTGEGATGLDKTADFDDYTIYDEGVLNEYGVLKAEKQKTGEGATGLDKTADFDDYTIYDEGVLNQYGVLKAEKGKTGEGATGLDKTADFDDYTIYDEKIPNKYAELKKEHEEGVGLDQAADFDDYTIYNEAQLIENGALKDQKQPRLEGGAGVDEKVDFDDYTIYDEGPLNKMQNADQDSGNIRPLPQVPAVGISSRVDTCDNSKQQGSHTIIKVKEKTDTAPGSDTVDFDDYTIYDEGPLNGVLKAKKNEEKAEVKVEAVGLDNKADFDDYTIYDDGAANGNGIPMADSEKQASGFDTKTAYDQDKTIYDQVSPVYNDALNKEGEGKKKHAECPDLHADFDDYTIYDNNESNLAAIKEMRDNMEESKSRKKTKVRTKVKTKVKVYKRDPNAEGSPEKH